MAERKSTFKHQAKKMEIINIVLLKDNTLKIASHEWCDANDSKIKEFFCDCMRLDFAKMLVKTYENQENAEQCVQLTKGLKMVSLSINEAAASLRRAKEEIDDKLEPVEALPVRPITDEKSFVQLNKALRFPENRNKLVKQLTDTFMGNNFPTYKKLYLLIFDSRMIQRIAQEKLNPISGFLVYGVIKDVGMEILCINEEEFEKQHQKFLQREGKDKTGTIRAD